MIYLDNAATTAIAPEVRLTMRPYLYSEYGNPNSIYSLGRKARDAVEHARCQVARLLGCSPKNIVFTSGGSEGNNFAMRSMQKIARLNLANDAILISDVEHDSLYGAANTHFQKVYYAGVDSHGVITPTEVETYLNCQMHNKPIGSVSIMCVNNETGAINDVKKIGTMCREKGIPFHTDCVQALGTVDMDDVIPYCDFATFSSHKIHGPKGVGCVYIRDPDKALPLIYGGLNQENGLRGGTENVAGIVGFGKAAELLRKQYNVDSKAATSAKQGFYYALCEALGEEVHVNGNPVEGSGKILNLLFPGIDAETMVLALDANGVCASAGSACHSNSMEPSRVLTMMGMSDEDAKSSVRFSFDARLSMAEVREAAHIVAKVVKVLRGIQKD